MVLETARASVPELIVEGTSPSLGGCLGRCRILESLEEAGSFGSLHSAEDRLTLKLRRQLTKTAGVSKGRGLLTKGTDKPRFDSDPSTAVAVHQTMRQQALRVPWREFSDACEQMIEWRSFALWVRAVVSAEQALPGWLQKKYQRTMSRIP